VPAAAEVLAHRLQAQEEALLWAITTLAPLVMGPVLERSLIGLITPRQREVLSALPVLVMGLGDLLRRNRGLMWAYGVLHPLSVRAVARVVWTGGAACLACVLLRDQTCLTQNPAPSKPN
jgi:hypothetical protein